MRRSTPDHWMKPPILHLGVDRCVHGNDFLDPQRQGISERFEGRAVRPVDEDDGSTDWLRRQADVTHPVPPCADGRESA